jgi:hypothetical protein
MPQSVKKFLHIQLYFLIPKKVSSVKVSISNNVISLVATLLTVALAYGTSKTFVPRAAVFRHH